MDDTLSRQELKLIEGLLKIKDPAMIAGAFHILGINLSAEVDDIQIDILLSRAIVNFREMPRARRREISKIIKEAANAVRT